MSEKNLIFASRSETWTGFVYFGRSWKTPMTMSRCRFLQDQVKKHQLAKNWYKFSLKAAAAWSLSPCIRNADNSGDMVRWLQQKAKKWRKGKNSKRPKGQNHSNRKRKTRLSWVGWKLMYPYTCHQRSKWFMIIWWSFCEKIGLLSADLSWFATFWKARINRFLSSCLENQ